MLTTQITYIHRSGEWCEFAQDNHMTLQAKQITHCHNKHVPTQFKQGDLVLWCPQDYKIKPSKFQPFG